jgi:predicted small lipoprotein YifL
MGAYKMNKFAVACAAAALMSLAACGEKPAAEANNSSNAVVNATENAANAVDNAANAVSNAANATNAAANATNAAE